MTSCFFFFFFTRSSLPSSVPYSGGKPTAQRRRSPSRRRPNSSPSRVSYSGTFRSSWRAAPTRSYWGPSSTRYSQRSGASRGRSIQMPVNVSFLRQNGNITELLLKEGFARCVDWSMAVYTQGAEKLRAAER